MPKPTIGQPNWGGDLNAHLDTLATAAAVAAKQDAATRDADVAGDINTPASATATALSATYARKIVARVSPLAYGFVGDGIADDTVALQATIDAAPDGAIIELPHNGNSKITAPLVINKPLTIQGSSRESQRILAVGCNGIEIAAATDSVRLRDFELVASPTHATTPNTLVGIKVDSTVADYCTEHLYENLLIDGFQTGIMVRYLWSSIFRGVRVFRAKTGLVSYGKSVNNFVSHCRFNVQAEAGSRGIALIGQESVTDATDVASEGWVISDSLTNAAEIGIDLVGTNHVSIGDCILDFNQLNGVRVIDNGTHFANNVSIHDTYFGMGGAACDAAVRLANTISNPAVRHARIHHNEMTVYAGATCTRGIYAFGSQAPAIIEGNVSTGFSTNDIWAAGAAGSIIRGNACLSTAPTSNITTGSIPQIVADNVGSVFRPGGGADANPFRRDSLGRKVVVAGAAPTAGTWARGDRVVNDLPAVGSPKGWTCTVAGTPGTWVSEGNL